MFDHIFRHLEACQKYSVAFRIFNPLLGVWKCGQTQYFVFDVKTSVSSLFSVIYIKLN